MFQISFSTSDQLENCRSNNLLIWQKKCFPLEFEIFLKNTFKKVLFTSYVDLTIFSLIQFFFFETQIADFSCWWIISHLAHFLNRHQINALILICRPSPTGCFIGKWILRNEFVTFQKSSDFTWNQFCWI